MTSTAQLFLAGALIKRAHRDVTNPLMNIGYLTSLPLAGSVIGGAVRTASPTEADRKHHRKWYERLARGAGRGAVVGTGSMVGRELGGNVGALIDGNTSLPAGIGAVGGMLAGGIAANRMMDQKNQYD